MNINRRNFLLGASASAVAAPGLINLATDASGVELPTHRSGGPSLWTQQIEPARALTKFDQETQADLVVVGGGYTGLACAYYTKKMRPDWKVIVLESHTVGSGASSRNSGAIYARHVGVNDPDMPQRGLERLQQFIETENINCDFRPASTLYAHETQSSAKQARDNLSPGHRWVSPQELRDVAGSDFYAGAVESPGFYKIQPAKLLQGYRDAVIALGVEIYEQSPVMDIDYGKPAIVKTLGGRVSAKHVCIATNAYSPRLGLFQHQMFPVHQYTCATRQLSPTEIKGLGLDRWDLRFEPQILPITFSLTASGHFFLRIVLGYASHDSTEWKDKAYARRLVKKIFQQRYPKIANIGLEHDWHGVTAHTVKMQSIAGPIADGNVHVSIAYNGLGIMPSHNNGYLTACRITGKDEQDLKYLTGTSGQIPVPGDYYRSLLFKPTFRFLQPV